ncbi:hypothetical protein HZS_6674 [Henneguya salminicola]|nr:hypothetical protein HZS_6674 [Henneguya salminicola]
MTENGNDEIESIIQSEIISPRRRNQLALTSNISTLSPIIRKIGPVKSQKKVKFGSSQSIIRYGRLVHTRPILIDELINEYILECEYFKTKPIEKLINQLEEYNVVEGRLPKIDLSGIRLDHKTVETLEIIFINLQTEFLNLENTMLDEDSCVAICEIIEYYDSASILHIGSNTRIGLLGWSSISRLVANSKSLKVLNMNRMVFTEQGVACLSQALVKTRPLRSLYLVNCYLNGTRLKILMKGIFSTSKIEEFYLSENKISSNDCSYIAEMIKVNKHLRVLDLENNSIQDLGLKYIFNSLVESCATRLESLQLWNTGITSLGMQYLAPYLMSDKFSKESISLRSLNIGKNKIGDEGLLFIKSALIQNTSLERLGLASTRLSPSGIITLAEIIADNKYLIRVDLRDNNINEAGVLALSTALRHNTSMLKINFNANFKIDAEIEIVLNRAVDDIKLKCVENREKAKSIGKIDDATSLFSGLSLESITLNNNFPAQSTLSSIFNFITYPWKYSKLKLFGSYNKVDIELNVDFPEIEETTSVISVENKVVEKKYPCDNLHLSSLPHFLSPTLFLNEDHSPASSVSSYNISRFQVKQIAGHMSHRRYSSENMFAKRDPNFDLHNSNAVIKLKKLSNQLPAINVIPPYDTTSLALTNSHTKKLNHKHRNVIKHRSKSVNVWEEESTENTLKDNLNCLSEVPE